MWRVESKTQELHIRTSLKFVPIGERIQLTYGEGKLQSAKIYIVQDEARLPTKSGGEVVVLPPNTNYRWLVGLRDPKLILSAHIAIKVLWRLDASRITVADLDPLDNL